MRKSIGKAAMVTPFLVAAISLGIGVQAMTSAPQPSKETELATFGGGCFWCMEPPYDNLNGVISTTPGYMGGQVDNPTYEQVTTGKTGHIEVVQIVFDPTKISFSELMSVFWRNIDPTVEGQQFADVGSQYQTAVFYHSKSQKRDAQRSLKDLEESKKFDRPIKTKLIEASAFYPAEDYHQDFYKKNPLRYNLYKKGSGREGFLKQVWGK